MSKNYTTEEVEFLKTNYDRGVEWVARELGRTSSAVRAKAYELGITNRHRPRPKRDECRDERDTTHDTRRKAKPDSQKNCNEDDLERKRRAAAAREKGQVMLRIDKFTVVMVPPHLATPEYAAKVRNRWAGKTN